MVRLTRRARDPLFGHVDKEGNRSDVEDRQRKMDGMT